MKVGSFENMKMLDPQFLNTDHLSLLKAGTKLKVLNHLNRIEVIVYRGYVVHNGWMPNSDTVIIHLLIECHSRIGLKTLCWSMYDDSNGYFTSVGNGTRYQIMEIIEPFEEAQRLVLNRFQTGIPWLSETKKNNRYAVA